MSNPSTHAKAPTAPTVEAQKARIHLGTILPQPARLVNRLRSLFAPSPPCPYCESIRAQANRLAEEILAARVLISAYEATAERQKGGQR
jgi:hypothetical protein